MRRRRFLVRNGLSLFLGTIERVGNALPHPATLFALFALTVLVLSWVAAAVGLQAVHPGTGAVIESVNLLSLSGLHRILTQMVANYTGFAPLGTVLVAMLGIGVMESSGFISAALRMLVLTAPRQLLTFVVVFAGVMSNMASEIGYVLLVPLGGMIFLSAGRHPIAGLAAAFAGVSGGYSANLLLGTVDPLLAGLSEEAARIVEGDYTVNPACNYYFMAASTFLIAAAGTWVTERVVIPRLGAYRGEEVRESVGTLTAEEKRGLRFAFLAGLLFALLLVWGTVPADGFLRDAQTGDLLRSPFLNGIVAFIFLGGMLLGVAYGIGARTYRNDADVIQGMGKTMSTLGSYMVLVFFAAQFVAYFHWSNLGLILAVEGAELLKASGLGAIPLMVAFVFFSAFVNLFMGSASAKWAIMAPVFVPMFMLLGYTPELTQAAYRIGDSSTNIISPMMSYFALIVAFFERYEKKAGIGTVIATMLPYTAVFLFCWTLLLGLWMAFELPLGPGARLYLRD
ncbi:MAG: AbgT family transporter [Acidobacteriia bacterium]|mgnify:CR=1 FL=1|jgi:aminobenzoyl-glutamate transport protein|nr:AbgT family transporter [Terriglobia bacterium]